MRSPGPDQLGGALRDLLEPVVSGAGFEIDDIDVRTAGRRHAVKVVVDRPESDGDDDGVGLDAIAGLSRAAAETLDAHEHLIEGSYTLEVTSPGVDRPLTRPRHWRRARLRLAAIRLRGGEEIEARIGTAGENGVQVAVTGKKPALRELTYAEVEHAQVQVEFRPPPKAEVALLDPTRPDPTDTSEEGS
ncbi:ribosome maturation factor RimP [Pseudonocardia sediminis]|uniref:Ribosome maturation factor RimP n=1 Tax=Pseudonocardia sediminis TaxID=1397368 RepID=A0A4Q7UVA5_PSEST|nr:ribosome maturation factor RimP [Pseudonocardia sediminis]RZT84771.1 ribosome maturation factor RimP [Pseudonocardia sediminis]